MTSLNRFLCPEIVTRLIKHGNGQVSSKLRPTKIHQNTSSFNISQETSAKGTPSICEERSGLAPATTRGALWNLSLQGAMAVREQDLEKLVSDDLPCCVCFTAHISGLVARFGPMVNRMLITLIRDDVRNLWLSFWHTAVMQRRVRTPPSWEACI